MTSAAITVPGLYDAAAGKCGTADSAGILASAVTVKDCFFDTGECLMCVLYCGYTEIRPYLVCHGEPRNAKIYDTTPELS